MELTEALRAFSPFNEQEARDREAVLRAILTQPDIFTRENAVAHMSASAWIVDERRERVLMAWHNIYRSWSWLGGHADGERDLLRVAVREACEESGLRSVRPVNEAVFSVEILTVNGHEKRGTYVSSHLHYNVTYLLEADAGAPLRVKRDENSAVKWFALDQAVAASDEPWMRERVYKKLNQKLRAFKGEMR